MSTSPSRPKKGRRLRARSPWQIRRAKPRSSAFIIKKYPDGKFSGQLDTGGIAVGADVKRRRTLRHLLPARRPRRSRSAGGGGLRHVADLVDPARSPGQRRASGRSTSSTARAPSSDLFYLDRIAALTEAHPEVTFVPVLSHAGGRRVLAGRARLRPRARRRQAEGAGLDGDGDVYACGPPPMIDALQPGPVHARLRARAHLLRQVHAVVRCIGRMSPRPIASAVT